MTMEARVRVARATDMYSVVMGFQTASGTAGATAMLSLFADHIVANVVNLNYDVDMSTFRTLRLAMDASKNVSLWVDGTPALSWQDTSRGGQNGVRFGSDSTTGTSDSYWGYVGYSEQLLPVPEPSSFLALLAGVGGSGILLRRKKH